MERLDSKSLWSHGACKRQKLTKSDTDVFDMSVCDFQMYHIAVM